MADLLVTPHTPTLGSGQSLRTYGVVKALAASGPVDVLYTLHGADRPSPEYQAIPNVTYHAVIPSRGLRRGLLFARLVLSGVPKGFAQGVSPEVRRAVERLAAEQRPERVVADGPIAATAAARLARQRPVIYNAHNLESAFRKQAGALGFGEDRVIEPFERRLLRRSSEAWMVSPKDLEDARRLAPGTAMRYVPNVVDVRSIEPLTPAGEQRAMLVADFGWPPNAEAASFLVDQVMPRVWRELPTARLRLVGRGLDPAMVRDERIEAAGFVDNLRDAYAASDCVLVPLLSGGGSPLKFVEALAYGLPVVATSHAAAGLEARAGEHYREADSADAFATALVELLPRGDQEMAARARALAEQRYSIEALARILGSEQPMEVRT